MRIIIILIVLNYFTCHGQEGLFVTHKSSKNYPFKTIPNQHDSAYYLIQNFYFACRENDMEKSNAIKQIVNERFQSEKWTIDQGIWDYSYAYYYRLNGDLDKAILFYNQAKQHFTDKNYILPIIWSELGIANCDYYLNRRDQALEKYYELYKKSLPLDLYLSANLSFNIAVLNHEKYSISLAEKEDKTYFNKAIEYYKISLKQNSEIGEDLGMSHVYGLYGGIHTLIEEHEKAGVFLDSAMFYAKRGNLLEQIAFIQIKMGQNLIVKNKVYEGIQFLDSAIVYYERTNNFNMNSLAHLRKAQAFAKTGDFENAFNNSKIRTELNKKTYTQSLIVKSTFYETEFKTKELEGINSLQKDKIKQISSDKLQLQNRFLTRTIWIIALVVILLFTSLGFYFISKNRAKKNALKEQNLKIKMQNKLISETIKAQDEVRIAIGRDIHDGLCQTITGVRLNQLQLQKELNKIAPDIAKKLGFNTSIIEDLYNDARELSHMLTPSGILHNSLKNLLSDVVDQMLSDYNVTMNNTNLSDTVFESNPEKKLHIVRIFQELTTNIVKHSKAKNIQIQMYERKGFLILQLEDDGEGISKLENQNGFGMQSINCRAEIMNGTLSFESNNGLTSLLKVPLN